jgi:hypothetical protein
MNATACVPNIGPSGIRRRRRLGLAALAAALLAFAALAATGAPAWRYLLLAPLLAGAASGWSQAREKT